MQNQPKAQTKPQSNNIQRDLLAKKTSGRHVVNKYLHMRSQFSLEYAVSGIFTQPRTQATRLIFRQNILRQTAHVQVLTNNMAAALRLSISFFCREIPLYVITLWQNYIKFYRHLNTNTQTKE